MFQDIDLHAEPAVLAPQLDDPDLLGRAVVHRTGRTRRVDRFDPALDGALTEIVLLHDLPLGLADVVELDYLPLELVGEMPGVPGAPHAALPSLAPLTELSISVWPIQKTEWGGRGRPAEFGKRCRKAGGAWPRDPSKHFCIVSSTGEAPAPAPIS